MKVLLVVAVALLLLGSGPASAAEADPRARLTITTTTALVEVPSDVTGRWQSGQRPELRLRGSNGVGQRTIVTASTPLAVRAHSPRTAFCVRHAYELRTIDPLASGGRYEVELEVVRFGAVVQSSGYGAEYQASDSVSETTSGGRYFTWSERLETRFAHFRLRPSDRITWRVTSRLENGIRRYRDRFSVELGTCPRS